MTAISVTDRVTVALRVKLFYKTRTSHKFASVGKYVTLNPNRSGTNVCRSYDPRCLRSYLLTLCVVLIEQLLLVIDFCSIVMFEEAIRNRWKYPE